VNVNISEYQQQKIETRCWYRESREHSSQLRRFVWKWCSCL